MEEHKRALKDLPIFSGLPDSDYEQLLGVFERKELEKGDVLFEAGSQPKAVFLLVQGSVSVRSDEGEVLVASSPAPIGELSAMTGEDRALTAVAGDETVVLSAPVDRLQQFLEEHGTPGYRFQRNMLWLAARKIGRDRERLRQMRQNIINTQKAMKAMRDALLESEDNALHEALFEQLDALIEHNRRVHYLVEPSRLVPTAVRLEGGDERRVTAISEEWLYFEKEEDDPELSGEFAALLLLDDRQVPISGTVEASRDREVIIFLDELVPPYKTALVEHITRAQILDVVL